MPAEGGIAGQEVEVSDQDLKNSDLVEVVKRSGTFRNDWGILVGAYLMNRSINAAVGRRPIWWSGLVAAVVGVVGWWIKS